MCEVTYLVTWKKQKNVRPVVNRCITQGSQIDAFELRNKGANMKTE